MKNRNEVNIIEYKDCIGGYGIPCNTNYYKMRNIRVNKTQKDQYIKDFGLDKLKSYDAVLDWLILNFYTNK